MAEVVRLISTTERLFEEYRVAAERAQQTHDFADGVKAGQAWGRFVMEFVAKDALDKVSAR